MYKAKIGVIGLKQHNFLGDKEANYRNALDKLKGIADRRGFDVWHYNELIVTEWDAQTAIKAAQAENLDFVILCFASFASGLPAKNFADAFPFLGLWAPEEPEKEGILKHNSLCGVHMYTSMYKNYNKLQNIKSKWFFGTGSDFEERLTVTVQAISTINRLKTSRVGLIGGIADGFNDLYFDERNIKKVLGVNAVRNIEYSEMLDIARSYTQDDIKETVQLLTSGYREITPRVMEWIEQNARVFMAYKKLVEDYKLDAAGISCWAKLQKTLNLIACSTIAQLNEYVVPAACEGDLPGAVSMLALKYITGQVTTLLDFVEFDEKDESVQLWHCGPTAKCMADKNGACLDCFYEVQEGVVERRSAMHSLIIAPGSATVMRFTGDLESMFISGGEIIPEKDGYFGSKGWMNKLTVGDVAVNAKDYTETVLTAGIEHHFALTAGAYTNTLMEMAYWLGMDVIKPINYKPYAQ